MSFHYFGHLYSVPAVVAAVLCFRMHHGYGYAYGQALLVSPGELLCFWAWGAVNYPERLLASSWLAGFDNYNSEYVRFG